MPEIPPEAVLAAAEAAAIPEWRARLALEAAAPILAEAVARKIATFMNERGPKSRGDLIGGTAAEQTRRRTWRRHFGIAARVAAGAFYTEEDMKRLTAEAIARGDFIISTCPEVPDAP